MAEKEKMSIVLFSGELDKALAAFMLATTGASMGMEVKIFFTFWGLNVIKKN
jgi:peroxiredoxin family protein